MKLKKVIIIDSCADCPKLIDINISLNFNGSKFFCRLGKREINIKEQKIHLEIPDWCPLPDRKGED